MHGVSVLSQWSSRLTVQIPGALLDWFQKAFMLKTSTSLVRHAYIQAMLGAFKGQFTQDKNPFTMYRFWYHTWFDPFLGDTLAQALQLIPLLLQTVEKAAAQNSQHALLSEGVAASVLLSRLSLLETVPGDIHIFSNHTPLQENWLKTVGCRIDGCWHTFYRSKILRLLELNLGWQEAAFHYREVHLPVQWWKWGYCYNLLLCFILINTFNV